jgi:hypothetical protein
MGSVAKRRCARGAACYQVRVWKLEAPPTLRATRQGDICEKCEEELAGGYRSSSAERWKDEVAEAIQAVRPGKAVLWDLFALNPDNGGWKKKLSDRGEVLMRLDTHTLTNLRDWLEENRDRAVEDYGYYTWLDLRTTVGLVALLAQLPPNMQLLSDTKDGLPIQVAAVRTDGKRWDLNVPIRAALLRRLPRYFSERDYAKLLGISRKAYRRLRDAIKQEGFTLEKFTPDVLDRIVRGKKRGP